MQTGDERNIFLSTMPATRRDRRAALIVVGVSAVLFAFAVPFAGVPLAPVPAFIASYQSALAINDLITAILLFSQFAISAFAGVAAARERISVHRHARPSSTPSPSPACLRPTGLLGAGSQTTVWLYMIWHGGFPLLVLGYALLKAGDNGPKIQGSTGSGGLEQHRCGQRGDRRVHLARHRAARRAADPAERRALHAGHAGRGVDGVVLQPRGAAVLWLRRPHSVLDIWLMVVMMRLAVRHRAVGDPQRRPGSISASISAASTACAPRASCSPCC